MLGLLAPLTLCLLMPQEAVADAVKPANVGSLPAVPSQLPTINGQPGPSDMSDIQFETPLDLDDFAVTGNLSGTVVNAGQAGGVTLSSSPTAKVALERARLMMPMGSPELVERELLRAIQLAPKSIDAQRTLAYWYTKQAQWSLAAPAWQRLTTLLNLQKTKSNAVAFQKALKMAHVEYLDARSRILPEARNQVTVAIGENTGSPASTDTRSVAAVRPQENELAQPWKDLPPVHGSEAVVIAEPVVPPQPGGISISLNTTPERERVLIASAPGIRPVRSGVTATKKVAEAKAKTQTRRRRKTSSSKRKVVVKPVAKPAGRNIAPVVSRQRQAQAWPFVERATKAMQARNYNNANSLYQKAYNLDPNNKFAQAGVAESLMLLKRYAPAEAAYRRALTASPNDAKLRRSLADVLLYQNKRDAAIDQYKVLLSKNKRDYQSAYQIAQIHGWSKRYNEASEYYRQAVEIEPNNADIWAAWGETLSYSHDTSARAAFTKALQIDAANSRAQIGLANLYTWNGEYPQAVEAFRGLLAREPRNLQALVGLGNALTFSGERDAAAEQYRQALAIDANSAEANLGLGRALIYSREFAQGSALVQKALAADPGNTEALQLLAQAQSNTPSEGDIAPDAAALATYERLLKIQTDPEEQANTWAAIAQLKENSENFEEARAAYAEAMRLAPDNVEIPLVFAQSLIYEDKWDEARGVVESVLRRAPDNVRALVLQVSIESKIGSPERATALARRIAPEELGSPEDALMLSQALRNAGQPEAAERIIQYLASQSLDNPTVALQVATIVRDSGQYESAIGLYQRLIAANPANNAARVKLAETLIWTKQTEAATEQVNAVLATDANNTEARILLATLQSREGDEGKVKAEAEIKKVLADHPDDPKALSLNAQFQSTRGLFEDAVKSFQSAVAVAPNNLEARLGLARNLYYAKRTTEAIKEYEELVRRAPADTTVKLELARVYLDQSDLGRAEALYRDIIVASRTVLPVTIGSIKGGVYRAYARVSPDFAAPAKAAAKVAPKVAPKSERSSSKKAAPARTRLAQATAPTNTGSDSGAATGAPAGNADNGAMDAGNTPGALPAPQAAPPEAGINSGAAPLPEVPAAVPAAAPEAAPAENGTVSGVAPGSVDTPLQDQVAALRGLGEIRRRQNRYDESIGFYEQALGLDGADAASRLGLAQSLRSKGEYVRALAEVDRVVATDATNLPARVVRAQLLGDTGKPQEAQQELDAVVAALPEEPTLETYLTMAGAFTGLRNYDTALQLLTMARRDFPTRPEPLRRSGEVLTFAKRWNEAEAAFDELIKADEKDVEAIIGKARVYNYSTRLEVAEGLYRKALEVDPGNQVALIELGNVLTRRSNWNEAITLYRSAIERNPADLATRVELARVLRYNRQFQEAEGALNQVLLADARYAPALTERGVLRGQQGNYEPAIADLRAAVAITPTDSMAQLGLAEVLGYADQYDESIKIYQGVLTREPDNEKALVELGLVYSYAGRYDEALAQLEKVTAKNPQNISAQTGKASVLVRMRRVPEAIALYQQVLTVEPLNRRAQIGLAQAYVTNRDYKPAIAIYDRLIAAEPTTTAYRVGRARTIGYSRDFPTAIAELRTIVQAEPANTEARLALAQVLVSAGEERLRGEAINQYQTVLRTEPDNVDARIGLGRVYSYTRRTNEAERELKSVLTKYPDNPEALYALADAQRIGAKPFEAEKNYQRVLKLEPNNENAKINLGLVERQTAPSTTFSARNYSDTNDVRLKSYTLGVTVPTPVATFGISAERGTFEDAGVELRRRALNLLLARRFGPIQARLILSRVNYSAASDKNLYDLLLQQTQGSRQRVFFNVRRLDIVESLGAVTNGINATQYRVGVDHPLGDRFDAELEARRYEFNDDNNRTTLLASVYYRLRPQSPTFRIGLGVRSDDSRFVSPFYYSPQNLRSLDALADYTVDRGKLRAGVSLAVPISGRSDAAGGGNNRRDSKSLFGYANYDLSELVELFVNGGIVRSSDFDSNDVTGGITLHW